MPFFKSSQEWLDQSILLLEARPTTTRITTRYSIKAVRPRSADRDPKPPRGSLVITTYDPVSGANLKYRTTKAAEVTRLMQNSLGRLGRCMAALPPDVREEGIPDAEGEGSGAATPVMQPPQQGAGGKKKKRGRK